MKDTKTLLPRVRVQRTYKIEHGDIRKFAHALGASDPVHYETEVAQKIGYRDIVAPITFPASMDLTDEIGSKVEMDPHRLMLVSQSWEYDRPICAGDEVIVAARIAESTEKSVGSSSKVTFVVVETTGKTKKDAPLFKGTKTYIYSQTR